MNPTVHLPPPPLETAFHRERHIKYHLRCLKTLLPTQYTTNDSNRMLLAFLTLNALDLLSALDAPQVTGEERQGYIDWIYRCQLPTGGFRGFTGADPGDALRKQESTRSEVADLAWDPANLAGTFFALVALLALGDDLARVRRRETLIWLTKLQWKEDGSLGEVLGVEGRPEGRRDIRFCYMCAAIRYILRCESDAAIPDLDVERLADFVLSSQAYDGGFGRQPMHEGNAGWTYCAVACLKLLGRLPDQHAVVQVSVTKISHTDFSMDRLLHWLASLQIPCPEEPASDEEPEAIENAEASEVLTSSSGRKSTEWPRLFIDPRDIRCAGLNGRSNKPADTCYSFWAVGALEILDHTTFIDWASNRRYLLERTQHAIGGFGKTEGDPPDILHSSLGVAALSFMHEPGIKRLDPVLCLSIETRQRLETIRRSWNQAFAT